MARWPPAPLAWKSSGASAVPSGGLDDPIGPDTPGTDANPPHGAIDDGLDPLEVRLEPPRSDVVRVTVDAPDNRRFAANFALFCHMDSFRTPKYSKASYLLARSTSRTPSIFLID